MTERTVQLIMIVGLILAGLTQVDWEIVIANYKKRFHK